VRTPINSRSNEKIKLARSLLERKGRQETGLFLAEGIRTAASALEAGAPIEFLLYSPDLLTSDFAMGVVDRAEAAGIVCYILPGEVFANLSGRSGPQGLAVVARQTLRPIFSLEAAAYPWPVALIAAQDPGNIGTILRSMDAAGADGLILLEGGSDPWHPSAVRASMGTVFSQTLVQAEFFEFAAWAKTGGYSVFGASSHGSVLYDEYEYTQPCVLLLGSERTGLTPDQAAICDALVRIPMAGKASSLNLGVAAGILLFEIKRKVG